MNRTILLIPLFLASHAAAENSEGINGLLGFTNGDQLHGKYLGFSQQKLRWQRDDLASAPEFELANVRRVILRNGQPEVALKTLAHAATIQGDRIPGRIISLDDEQLVLESEFAGSLSIPRDRLGMLAPSPFGGKIYYQGPFAEDEWEIVESRNRIMAEDMRVNPNADANADQDPDAAKGWVHSGAAWYWPGDGSPTALARKEGLPERAMIRCHVSWKSRISLALAFHADFKTAPEAEADEQAADEPRRPAVRRRFHPSDTSIYAELFGNSYVLQLNPTHAMLYRATMDDDGKTKVDRMHTSFNNVNLGESGSAAIEIRASRPTGEISLFINDEFVAQWSEIGHLDEAGDEIHPYVAKGGGLAFLMQSTNCSARISDILVADWNGMPDAARSLQTQDHDIVLLTNGTDRFSGKVTGISDGRVSLVGRYGDFVFPLDEVSEIRFARATLSEPEAVPANTISLRIHPLGILSGVPVSGDGRHLRLDHPACGPIDVDLSSVVILEMYRGESFLDAWDPDF
jgi:hypothetical protein